MSAEDVSNFARQKFAAALNAIGAELVDSAKEALSVPVAYAGSFVIRSKPGEFPRRETSELLDDTQFAATSGEEPSGSVYWTVKKAMWLNDGTKRGLAPRPIADLLVSQWAEEIPAMIAANWD